MEILGGNFKRCVVSNCPLMIKVPYSVLRLQPGSVKDAVLRRSGLFKITIERVHLSLYKYEVLHPWTSHFVWL